jgi:hypothetical protein
MESGKLEVIHKGMKEREAHMFHLLLFVIFVD